MFENIRLQEVEDYIWEDQKRSIPDAMEKGLAEINRYYMDHPEESSYHLEGLGKILMPALVSDEAKACLLYIQVFGVMDANPSFYTVRKNHESYLLCYTYNGEGMLEYDGHTYTLGPGEGFWIDCRKLQSYRTTAAHWYHSTLHFFGGPAQLLYQRFSRDGKVFFRLPVNRFQPELESVLQIEQAASAFREMEASLQLQKLLLKLIKEKYRDMQTVPEHIAQVKIFLEAHSTQRSSLEQLAKMVSVSQFHLAREFKKYTGFTVNDYLIQLRINRACTLLSSTEISVTLISQLVGCSNYSNFYKLFCKKIGCSPQEYRNRSRG